MFKKIHLLFALAFAVPAVSQARVGGPFDGADYNILFDDTGIYQAIMRMPNGSGMMQFGVNVNLQYAPTAGQGGGGGTATVAYTKGSVLNRSVVYLEGVTYFGMASGAVDHDRGMVEGLTNGQSDVSSQQTNGGGGAQNIPVVANNARGWSCNTEFTAKIVDRGPDVKFSGRGTVTVLTQTTAAQTAMIAQVQLAQQALQTNTTTAFTASNTALLNTAPVPNPPTTAAQVAAYTDWYNNTYLPGVQANLATALANQLNNQSAFQDAYDAAGRGNQATSFMTVYGSRKFFGSQR